MHLSKRLGAEIFGTFWLVLGGCGSAVLAAAFPQLGIGFAGVALAFGLTVLTMAYAIGHVSGCHLNPAVSIGLATAGRFPVRDLVPYIVAQVIGATLGAWVIYLIATGNPSFDFTSSGFAANGFGEHSPGHFSMVAALVCEVAMTFFFLFVILGATDDRAPKGFAPLAIGLCLTLIHLISIPVTNTSVNPARSSSQAFFVGGWALDQLWMFWIAPIVGAILAGLLYPALTRQK
jgi:aquaporin Z